LSRRSPTRYGLTPSQIGSYMGIILLPWSLKLINDPITDRWSFLAMGRRRPWVMSYPHLFYVVGGCGLFVISVVRLIDVDAHLQRMESL